MTFLGNPAGVDGLAASGRPLLETVVGDVSTILAGDVVALSTVLGHVIRNLPGTGAGLQLGVALKAVTVVGGAVDVVTNGYATVNKGTGAITAGQLCIADTVVSGAVGAVTAATAITQAKDVRGFIGVAIADASAAAATAVIRVRSTM